MFSSTVSVSMDNDSRRLPFLLCLRIYILNLDHVRKEFIILAVVPHNIFCNLCIFID